MVLINKKEYNVVVKEALVYLNNPGFINSINNGVIGSFKKSINCVHVH